VKAKSSRILVTGASGFLGRRLVPFLRERGHHVIAGAQKGDGEVRADLTKTGDAARLLADTTPETIVHLVAHTNVDQCERDPQAAYALNVTTVANLVDAIRGAKQSSRFVLISTDQVYDAAGDNPETAVMLRNTYALTKLAGERVASEIGGTVLRTNFFGKSHTPGRASFTDWLIGAATAGKDMTLLTDVYFSPLSVETLSAGIARVVERPTSGVFNLGSHAGMSKRDFSHTVATRLGLSLAKAKDGTQDDLRLDARRPKGMMMDSRRFEAAFDMTLPTLESEIQTAEL
jgi:dTDP-4-dehydrorhamnose reductase